MINPAKIETIYKWWSYPVLIISQQERVKSISHKIVQTLYFEISGNFL